MINYCDVVVEVRLWGSGVLMIGARIELLMLVSDFDDEAVSLSQCTIG